MSDGQQPPAAVVRRTHDRVAAGEPVVPGDEIARLDLRRVRPDLYDAPPPTHQGRVGVSCREALAEAPATLLDDGAAGERRADRIGLRHRIESARERDHDGPSGPRRRRERVEQAGRGELGGGDRADARGEASLREPGHRRLGDDEDHRPFGH
jgi:hypothetical protein